MMTDKDTNNSLMLHVLVTAHPDDESLFFIPTIRNIQQASGSSSGDSQIIWLLCLTNGNYNGLGKVRAKELFYTCQTILKLDHVILLEEDADDDIVDDPQTAWHIPQVATRINQALEKAIREKNYYYHYPTKRKLNITLITFDEQGVSGHINHRDTYQAVRYLFQRQRNQNRQQQKDSCVLSFAEVWTLQTETNLLFKYIPIYSWFLLICVILFGQQASSSSLLTTRTTTTSSTDNTTSGAVKTATCLVYRLHQPLLNWKAMASHASQFVWYRRLFVIFSCYTYVNRLQRMSITTATTSTTTLASASSTTTTRSQTPPETQN